MEPAASNISMFKGFDWDVKRRMEGVWTKSKRNYMVEGARDDKFIKLKLLLTLPPLNFPSYIVSIYCTLSSLRRVFGVNISLSTDGFDILTIMVLLTHNVAAGTMYVCILIILVVNMMFMSN